jgi:hypothetical protein
VQVAENKWEEQEICMPYDPDLDDDNERAVRYMKVPREEAEAGR